MDPKRVVELVSGLQLEKPVSERAPQVVVIGTADIGDLRWCEAQGTLTQEAMESGYAARALDLAGREQVWPDWVQPTPALKVLTTTLNAKQPQVVLDGLKPYRRVELEECANTFGLPFVAGFTGQRLGIEPKDLRVLLVGIPDGIRADGTVLEVRWTTWEYSGVRRNQVELSKADQANIYASLLGLPRYEVITHCKDGRFVHAGPSDLQAAMACIRAAVLMRIGQLQPRGVSSRLAWRCRRCDHRESCEVKP